MKEELTRAVIEALAKYSGAEYSKCENCPAAKICDSTDETSCKWLATALLEEINKPKVWDNAPEDAIEASVTFFKKGEFLNHVCKTYTREIPKTRARQIAEEATKEYIGLHPGRGFVDIVESALEKYAAELGTTT